MPINKGSGGGAPPPARSSSASPSSAPTGPVQWEIPSSIFSRRVVFMDVWGDTDTGRTSLALTAPGPIALIHANEKIDGVVAETKARGVDIRTFNFGGVIEGDNPDEIAASAMPLWRRFCAAYVGAYEWARTIVVDTHPEAWELERIAYFGGYKPEGGRTDSNYGPLNFEWKGLFARRFRAQDRTNLILIGQSTDEYTKTTGSKMGERTGKSIWSGQKHTKFMVDVRVRMSRDKDGGFVATIEKGWNNAASEGVEFVNRRAQFAKIMATVTKTEEGEWK